MSAYANIGQIIKAAYSNLGIVDIEGDISPAQYQQGLNSVNSMIGAWSRKRITLQGLFDEVFTLVAGQTEYTVGSGLNFNTTRPIEIDNAYIRDTNNIDYPLEIITQNQYDIISLKTLQTRPNSVLFNPRTSVATLFPVPNQGYSFHWTVLKLITSFATIEDAISLPEEYEEAIEFNLSLRLSPKCNVPVSKEVALIASTSMANLIIPVDPAVFDGAFSGSGRYNIFTDNR